MIGKDESDAPRTSSWLAPSVRRSTAARVRLFCLPYAGVGASVYRHWATHLPEVDVRPIQLPGRENRMREPALGDLEEIVDLLTRGLLPDLTGTPFALYGHSFGALVAFEMARRLRDGGGQEAHPAHVIVAARRAPGLPSRFPAIAHLPDDEFVAALEEHYGNGIPEEVARERELMEFLLPTLRADVTADEGYSYREAEPLPCGLTALWASDDPSVLPEEARGWAAETSGPFTLALIPGDHFFARESSPQLFRIIARALGTPAPAFSGK